MLILAIDTSTEQAGLALMEDGTPRTEWAWTAAGNHSHHLDTLLRSMLAVEGMETRALTAIVAATGPGSFSGLRVGVSFAKGLALALGIPLVGVSTLDVAAFPSLRNDSDVLATIPAGREQLYVGHYRGNDQCLERTGEYAIMLPSEAATLVKTETILAGPGALAVAEELARDGRQARMEPAVWRLRRPGFLAELGRRLLAEGREDQVHMLEPLYLRRSAAEEKRMARRDGSQV